jgi:hypothetical protein
MQNRTFSAMQDGQPEPFESSLRNALLGAAFDDSDEMLNAVDRAFDPATGDLHRRFGVPSSELDLILDPARDMLADRLSRLSRNKVDVDRAVSAALQILSEKEC